MNATTHNETWRALEGRLIHGELPLLRCLVASDRSAVFRTESVKHAQAPLAIELVRAESESADAQLSRWQAASERSHPNLIRIFEAGRCELGELSCVYALMEYADQNLAQLLEQRTLSEHEVREMLPPTLNALAYLHERNLVAGELNPSNILAVGDELKLASGKVLPIGKHPSSVDAASAYVAPEAREGDLAPGGDIWALGITLCEALTGRLPPRPQEGSDGIELPQSLQESFRDIIARCLKTSSKDRPTVDDLRAWLHGGAPKQPDTSTLRLVIRAEILPEDGPRTTAPRDSSRRWLVLTVAIAAAAILTWIGERAFKGDSDGDSPGEPEVSREIRETSSINEPRQGQPLPTAPAPVAAIPAPSTSSSTTPAPTTQAEEPQSLQTSPSPVNEVAPNAPQSALDTIRGTVRVVIRVTIGPDGAVLAATSENPGPSRYFERLSLAAAKEWTFTPAETEDQRTALLRFHFTRTGVTARVEPQP